MPLETLNDLATLGEQRTKLNALTDAVNALYEFNPTDPKYGAVGDYDETTKTGTDNTAAINAMMDDVRALIIDSVDPSNVQDRCLVRIVFPRGRYLCSGSLNFTGIRAFGWAVEFQGAEIVSKAAGKVSLDARGSRYGRFIEPIIYGHESASPLVGMAIGRTSVGNTCDLMRIDGIRTDGIFTLSSFYNLAAETVLFEAPHLYNKHESFDSYSLIQDGKTDFDVPSDFVTPSAIGTPHSFNENLFLSADIRKARSGPAIYLSRTTHHKFVSGYAVVVDSDTIVIDSDGYGNPGLELDIHCESSDVTPGIVNAVRLQGVATQNLTGFKFYEHGNHAQNSIIKIDTAGDHGSAITSVNFIGSDISIMNEIATPINGVFSDPSVVTYSGSIKYLSGSEPTGLDVARMTGSIIARTTGFTKPLSGTYTTTATNTGVVTNYPSGSYTPTVDFDTTGDLNVAYATQVGYFTVSGNTCHVSIRLIFTPTYATAAGKVKISLPVLSLDEVNVFSSLNLSSHSPTLTYPAGYTSIDCYVARSDDFATIRANGSGQNFYELTVAEVPSESQQVWTITGSYLID